MRSSVIWSFLSVVALATGALMAGCDNDATIAKSGVGESCDSSNDCSDGLKCIQGACYKTASTPDGGAGEGTGGTTVGPTPPVLGNEGESCTKAADCSEGLGCYNQRCIPAPTGEGGEGNIPGGPQLGGPGETCGLTSDCEEGLRCLPNNDFGFDIKAAGSNSVGVCTQLDTNVEPSGKTCGHECLEAADCCELPVAQHAALGAYSCSDLAELVADVPNCETAVGLNGARCLAYASYCDDQCGAKTWACEAGLCQYTAKCTKPTEVVGGCPTYTRGGHTISSCDTKAGKCAQAVAEPTGCTTDKSCFSPTALPIADGLGDTCSEGECVCYKPTGGCYRACNEATDCAAGYTCDDATSLCVPRGSCTTDTQCVIAYRDSRATCVEGVCQMAGCEHDIDCNPFGLVDGNFSSVCVEGTCKSLVGQCDTDDECPAYAGTAVAGGVRSFCGEPVVGEPVVTPVSAITD